MATTARTKTLCIDGTLAHFMRLGRDGLWHCERELNGKKCRYSQLVKSLEGRDETAVGDYGQRWKERRIIQ